MTKIQSQAATAPPQNRNGRILVQGLTRSFGEHTALHPAQLEIGDSHQGSITGLLGPNGSGKSTLLRMLTGLLRPDAGEAYVDDVQLTGDGTAIRKRCAYSPGELSLYDEMRGGEHLNWLLRGRGRKALGRALEIAESFELPLTKGVRTYSHGMKRQLLFAATMAPDLPVRILDEPTEGLDPSRRADVLDILAQDAASGTTILLSSHHLGEVARACNEIIFLNQGRVLAVEQASKIEARGRMRLKFSYASEVESETVASKLRGEHGIAAEHSEVTMVVQLTTDDPREFLKLISAQPDWPAPKTMTFGEISLEELYRSLYGVEGI